MLDSNSAYPLYAQIADQLRLNIRTEKWREGQKIPTEMELCEYYYVSRITIRKAIDELVRENLLTRSRAKGTFVNQLSITPEQYSTVVRSFTQEMLEQGHNVTTLMAKIEKSHADHKLAKALNLQPGDDVIVLERLRGEGSNIFAYFKTYIPYREDISLDSKDYYGSFYEYLKELGIIINQEREYIEAILPTRELQKLLKIKENDPVLKRFRFTSQKGTDFFEYTECFYIGNKYRYYIDFS